MTEGDFDSFITEIRSDGNVTSNPRLSVLQEKDEPPSSPKYRPRYYDKVQEDSGSEYDTDIDDAPSEKAEYDSSGKDRYLKICKDLNMTPVSHFTAHIKEPTLSLKHLKLGCKKTVAITQALMTNTFIENLDLSDNGIGCLGAISITNMLNENYFITELNLDHNNIGLKGIVSLCDNLSERSYVKTLSLAGNGLKDNMGCHLAEMLKQNYTLAKLNVSHNKIGCVGATALATALHNNDSLSELDISWNMIRSKGGTILGRMVGVNTGLINLTLSHNGLNVEGSKAVIRGMKTNEHLVCLDLTNTQFPGSQTKELGKVLADNTSLKILKIGNNPISEADLEILLPALQTSSLYILGLEDVSVSKLLYAQLCTLEAESGLVIHYGHSGGYQRSRPMTRNALLLDEFITTNVNKLAPLFVNMDQDNDGYITIAEFKECLKDAGLRILENQLNWLVDGINVSKDSLIPCKDLLTGPVPATLQNLRKRNTKSRGRTMNTDN